MKRLGVAKHIKPHFKRKQKMNAVWNKRIKHLVPGLGWLPILLLSFGLLILYFFFLYAENQSPGT